MSAPTCTVCNLPAKHCVCKMFSTLSPRPSDSHKLAVLFPPESKSPKPVWVLHRNTTVNKIQYEKPHVDPFLSYGPGDRFDAEQLLIEPQRIVRARNINHTLAVYMRDNFGSDGSKSTESAKAITEGQMKHTWRGPLLIVAMEGAAVPQKMELSVGRMKISVPAGSLFPRVRDVESKDLRIVVDYLLAYPY